jgi:membrane fusion protein (multidrug efflux system)
LDVAELAVDPRTGSIRLRSTFPNPDTVLLPGMFVRASVVDEGQKEGILIPQKAVTFDPEGGRNVWVIDSEDKVRKRSIRTGTANNNRWLVLNGLNRGERVVVEGSMGLSEGTEVRPKKIDPVN